MGQLGAAPARLAARRAGAGTLSKRGPTKGPRLVFSSEKKIRPHDPATTKRWTVGGRGLDWVPHARCRSKRTGRVTRVAERERERERGAARRGAGLLCGAGFLARLTARRPEVFKGRGRLLRQTPPPRLAGIFPETARQARASWGVAPGLSKNPHKPRAECVVCF